MVLPASDKIPRVSSYSGSCSLPLPLSPTGLSPSLAVLPITFGSFSASAFIAAPSTPYLYGLGFSPFARRYSGNHFCFLFLRVLGCFGSPGTSPFQDGILLSDAGFPHSDTGASSLPYSLAPLFAVRCVLLQLRVARHSPYALASLISLFSFSSFSDACFRDFFFYELFFCFQCHLFPQLYFRPFLLCLFLFFRFSKIDIVSATPFPSSLPYNTSLSIICQLFF